MAFRAFVSYIASLYGGAIGDTSPHSPTSLLQRYRNIIGILVTFIQKALQEDN